MTVQSSSLATAAATGSVRRTVGLGSTVQPGRVAPAATTVQEARSLARRSPGPLAASPGRDWIFLSLSPQTMTVLFGGPTIHYAVRRTPENPSYPVQRTPSSPGLAKGITAAQRLPSAQPMLAESQRVARLHGAIIRALIQFCRRAISLQRAACRGRRVQRHSRGSREPPLPPPPRTPPPPSTRPPRGSPRRHRRPHDRHRVLQPRQDQPRAWHPPSTSTTSLTRCAAKSAMYRPMGTCRRNPTPSRLPRSADHNSASVSVGAHRMAAARATRT